LHGFRLLILHFFGEHESITFEEVLSDENWRKVMDEEICTIHKNKMLELAELQIQMKSIGVKWVYKIKCKHNGEIGCFYWTIRG
jgi:hypothetical protein